VDFGQFTFLHRDSSLHRWEQGEVALKRNAPRLGGFKKDIIDTCYGVEYQLYSAATAGWQPGERIFRANSVAHMKWLHLSHCLFLSNIDRPCVWHEDGMV
jgi:hypothetical protein